MTDKATTVLCLPRELRPGHVIVRGRTRSEPGRVIQDLVELTVVSVEKRKTSPLYYVVLDDRPEPRRYASGKHVAVTSESYYRIQQESGAQT